mmetsp:Transcript_35790/g.64639  ORF Transcript_35790/g.64639 Transcript_35790/m.64639 type:complete len:247 (+) Transcript_35790:620-1360(+)
MSTFRSSSCSSGVTSASFRVSQVVHLLLISSAMVNATLASFWVSWKPISRSHSMPCFTSFGLGWALFQSVWRLSPFFSSAKYWKSFFTYAWSKVGFCTPSGGFALTGFALANSSMYAGRTPTWVVANIEPSWPLAACLCSLTASFRMSSLVFACSLKSFFIHSALLRSSRSWIRNWTRFEKAVLPSGLVCRRRSTSRAENWFISSFPCEVASRVKPMACSSSQTHSIICSSGRTLPSLKPTRSWTT